MILELTKKTYSPLKLKFTFADYIETLLTQYSVPSSARALFLEKKIKIKKPFHHHAL